MTTLVSESRGIGRQHAKLLNKFNIITAHYHVKMMKPNKFFLNSVYCLNENRNKVRLKIALQRLDIKNECNNESAF